MDIDKPIYPNAAQAIVPEMVKAYGIEPFRDIQWTLSILR
jgi:hypothetical protein